MSETTETLSDDECWELLEAADVGRVIFRSGDDDIEVFPVTHHIGGRTILFRSAPGAKLALVADRPRVAFEIDGHTDDEAWSVIAWGTAERLSADDEIMQSGLLSLVTWTDDQKHSYVRITPDRLSGRRFTHS
ncbi:pyridoxamine 5'-phosphate oxidase family protein [Salinibacterium sp. ZJ70]|uniref:pyridoxamine 5'-phosphate oxidase family protein n=1 Tax=Salinibacterium sp. ZJ70 TaxID=2708084 RepID=UPI00141F2FCD|nr:pyridoxamine 5'-phosphate oxidase family protein [Salinibacterium sp. ZJ70]